MTALLFVHGTGVRREAYDGTLGLLREGLARVDAQLRVEECYWGDIFGVPSGVGGAALPGAVPATELDTTTATDLSETDQDAVLWGRLYEDPWLALRTPDDPDDRGRPALGERMGPEVEARGRTLARAAELPADLRPFLPDEQARTEFGAALTAVLDSPAGRHALTHGAGRGRLPLAIATATVASHLGGILQRGLPLPWTPQERDDVVGIVTRELGGEARGVGRHIFRTSLWAAQRLGVMRLADRHRADLMTKAHPQAGDVLKYLARGDGLRAVIRQRVAETADAHGPVVLLAHSLGGIAAVDLLALEHLSGVRHLVTVGSQAAHLHEIGALPGLAPGKPLPEHFPTWTNIYDRRDLLGFAAASVFPDPRVQDREFSSGQPFIASHSAYFRNPDVHAFLAGLLRDVP
ncbi:hypothetical protein [Streptomyces sp. NPDC059862]|uniref:hypothetical protein n=1 Tax=unclassified Streptomyces TaxID=2593676 RepID=UPI003633DF67